MQSRQDISRSYKVSMLFLFLVLFQSIFSNWEIKIDGRGGSDFQNLHAFHHCEHANTPYQVSGSDCGAWSEWDMYKPPLHYWLYSWTRWFEFDRAYSVMQLQIVLELLLAFCILSKLLACTGEKQAGGYSLGKAAALWLLLLFTVPSLTLMLRGNSDSFVVFLWLLSSLFFIQKKFFWWASVGTIAAFFKLYPAIPCAIVGIAFLVSSFLNKEVDWRKPLLMAVLGALVTVAIIIFPLLDQHVYYFSTVLPEFTKGRFFISMYSHSVFSLNRFHTDSSFFVSTLIAVSWIVFSIKKIDKDPALVLTGCLAISTFFSQISFVYNLVTVFPLFLLLFLRSKTAFELIFLTLGVLFFLGDRYFWYDIQPRELRVILEVLWLLVLPVLCLGRKSYAAT